MRRLLLALFALGPLGLPVPRAHAGDGPDPCLYAAAQQALPYLQQSYAYSPWGYAGAGYAPLTYPFGASPYTDATYFGPPGLVPAFGPLGPGLTANLIAQGVLRPRGVNLTSPANVGTLASLAALQQAELAQLNTRYSNGAYYQTAAATWAGGYASQAATVFARAAGECSPPAASPPMEAPSGSGP
jgi:hypothetical protein